jgi:aspartate/methionine/tyrosine aminotransferase
VFSRRTPDLLAPNRLTRTLECLRKDQHPILDLTESNPTRVGLHYPAGMLGPLADDRSLVYRPEPFGLPEPRQAVADDYARRGVHVAPDRIVLMASTSDAYSVLFKLLCNPGDEVLVPRPSYPLFEHLAALDGVGTRPYDLEYCQSWSVDFTSLEGAWSDRVRAVLVVSPNNPTGSWLTRAELERLRTLCASRSAAIIADEVFADYPLVTAPPGKPAQILAGGKALTFGLGGLSKSVGLPQVKLAWCAVSGPDELAARALTRLELVCDTYLSVSSPVQAAAPELLTRGAAVRLQIQSRIAANYRHLAGRAVESPSCELLHAEAGWYAIVRVPALTSEEDLVLDLLTKHGVLVHPGYFFDFPGGAHLVLSLLPPEAVFADAVARVFRHFDCTVAGP